MSTRSLRIAQAFRPVAPIDQVALFAGRTHQIDDIIFQAGQLQP